MSEHRSCFNYQLRYESGFSRYELTAHEEGRIDNDGCFCVLFVLKGEVLVELGREHTISVHANRMLLIPQREENRLTGITPAECLLLFWNKEITVCDKMYFDSISHEKPIVTNDHTLPIRKPLLHALRQVLFYLETGLLCRHMHILKQQEIILILRGFYAKNELAAGSMTGCAKTSPTTIPTPAYGRATARSSRNGRPPPRFWRAGPTARALAMRFTYWVRWQGLTCAFNTAPSAARRTAGTP